MMNKLKIWYCKYLVKQIEKVENNKVRLIGELDVQLKRLDKDDFDKFCTESGYIEE